MGIWKNSFTDLAVSHAANWSKEIDRETTAYVTLLSPKLYEQLFKSANSMSIAEKQQIFASTKTDFLQL